MPRAPLLGELSSEVRLRGSEKGKESKEMIISTKKGTPKEELEKIVDKFEKQGLDVTLITGKD